MPLRCLPLTRLARLPCCCRGVAAWRVWLRDHGGGGVPYAGGTTQQPPRAWSRQEMLDRHALHAETCKACQEVRSCLIPWCRQRRVQLQACRCWKFAGRGSVRKHSKPLVSVSAFLQGLALCRAGAAAATAALAAAVLAAATRAAQAQARAAPLPVPFLASAGAAALVAWVLRTGELSAGIPPSMRWMDAAMQWMVPCSGWCRALGCVAQWAASWTAGV